MRTPDQTFAIQGRRRWFARIGVSSISLARAPHWSTPVRVFQAEGAAYKPELPDPGELHTTLRVKEASLEFEPTPW